MSNPTLVVFVRHGESTGNTLYKGDMPGDVPNHLFPLTEDGYYQAIAIGEYLKTRFGSFDSYFVSTFLRTRQTMRCIASEAKPLEDPRLDEWFKGVWHTLKKEIVRADFPHETAMREFIGLYHYRPLGGESGQDVECRIRSFLTDLRLDFAGKRVLIVGHGQWLQFFRKVLDGTHCTEFTIQKDVANCSVTICQPHEGRLCIAEYAIVP